MDKILIGIDPGKNGGIAVRDRANRFYTIKMPETVKDLWDFFANDILVDGRISPSHVDALMEKVGFHVQGNAASSSAKFARHCGHIEALLIAAEIPHTKVHPTVWMRAVCGVLPKEKKERKLAIKARMQERYPHIKVFGWNADALGILTHQIQLEKGAT